VVLLTTPLSTILLSELPVAVAAPTLATAYLSQVGSLCAHRTAKILEEQAMLVKRLSQSISIYSVVEVSESLKP
jgi:hypothetical protein